MRARLEAVVEELKRLQREGVRAVNVSEAALAGLRERIAPRPVAAGHTRSSDGGPGPGIRPDPAPAGGAGEEALPEFRPGESAPAARRESRVRGRPAAAAPLPSTPPEVRLPEGDKRTRWEALKEQVLQCPVCREHVRQECRVVFGVGDLDADLFFVGEAPGAEEEKQGEPFVGPAGALLDRIIAAMGLTRERVYIGNIMNWRPETPSMTGNRPPTEEEMAFCLPYLRAQIEIVRPKILVALGSTAVNGLLGHDPKRRMGKVRGTWREFSGIPLMVTYHPSYLLRYGSQRVKRTVWEDMLQVMERAGFEVSDRQRRYFLPKKQP